jgi:hypothetical protein
MLEDREPERLLSRRERGQVVHRDDDAPPAAGERRDEGGGDWQLQANSYRRGIRERQ